VRKGTRSRLLAALTTVLVLPAIAGCATGGSDTNAPPDQIPRLTLGVSGVPPQFLNALSYTAKEAGHYTKSKIDVELKAFAGTATDPIRALQAGQVDAGWVVTPLVLSAIANGVELVAIQGMDVIDWLVASNDPAVTKCENLKGQTIGVDSVGGARYAALLPMLESCGLGPNDISTANVPASAGVEAIIAGQLTVGVLHIDEVAQIEDKLKKSLHIAVKLADFEPDQHYDVLVTTKATLQKKRDALVRMIAGNIRAARYMYDPSNLTEVAKIATVSGRSETVAAASMKRYLEMKWWPLNDAGLAQKKIDRTIELNVAVGSIPKDKAPAYGKVVDVSLYKEALALVDK
jgi:NitT/TauT family transport system substrate-binding protein